MTFALILRPPRARAARTSRSRSLDHLEREDGAEAHVRAVPLRDGLLGALDAAELARAAARHLGRVVGHLDAEALELAEGLERLAHDALAHVRREAEELELGALDRGRGEHGVVHVLDDRVDAVDQAV